jgi:hypothetical protein
MVKPVKNHSKPLTNQQNNIIIKIQLRKEITNTKER